MTKIFFGPGTTVKAGDPLVQLNDAPERGDFRPGGAIERPTEGAIESGKDAFGVGRGHRRLG